MVRTSSYRVSPRGQNMLLGALTILFLGMMLVMTLSIGQRAKEKVELQTLADVSSLSTANATARTFNIHATLNRASISHWVAMMGTQALIAYATIPKATLGSMKYASMLTGMLTSPSLGGSVTCSSDVIAKLVGNDNDLFIQMMRDLDNRHDCHGLTWSECDKLAAQQVRDIDSAIERIEDLEWMLQQRLWISALDNRQYMAEAIAAADPRENPEFVMGQQTGCREVCHAVRDSKINLGEHTDQDLEEHMQATMGSRGNEFLAFGTLNDGATQVPIPKLAEDVRAQAESSLRAAHGLTYRFDVKLDPNLEICSYGSADSRGNTHGNRESNRGWRALAAESHVRATLRFDVRPAGCTGTMLPVPYVGDVRLASTNYENDSSGQVWASDPQDKKDVATDWDSQNSLQQWLLASTPEDADIHTWPMKHLDRMEDPSKSGKSPDAGTVIGFGIQEPDHTLLGRGTYGQTTVDTTSYRPFRHFGIFKGGFGLIDRYNYSLNQPSNASIHLPDVTKDGFVNSSDLYAMPKIAMLVFRKREAGSLSGHAWEQNGAVNFGLPGNPKGNFDGTKIVDPSVTDDYRKASALSSGFAYYHRRGHVREPPNMLNPFWRGTIVPMDIDLNGRIMPGSAAKWATNPAGGPLGMWANGDGSRVNDVIAVYPQGSSVAALYDLMVHQGEFRGMQ